MILVTGATGRVGRSLIPALKEKFEVRALTRGDEIDGVETVKGDVGEFASLDAAFKGVEQVIHLVSTRILVDPNDMTERVNYEGTRNVVNAAIKNNVSRFIFMSSCNVYGKAKYLPIDEKHPAVPTNLYGKTKLAAENYVMGSGLSYAILRPPAIYGRDFTIGFKNILEMVKDGRMKIVGDGKNHVHFVHIDDCILAFKRLMGSNANGIFNIAGPDVKTQQEILELSARLFGVEAPKQHVPFALAWGMAKFKEFGSGGTKTGDFVKIVSEDKFYDINKAKSALGFEPAVGYEKGIKDFIDTVF